MYSPHLFGRRSEFLALRALLTDGGDLGSLVPIVEPVMANTGDLSRCIEAFGKANTRIVVTVNPRLHEFAGNAPAVKALRKALDDLLKKYESVIPAFRVHPATAKASIDSFLAAYKNRAVALLYSSPELTDAEFKSLADYGPVAFHVVLDQQLSSKQLAMIPVGKLVDTRDHFNKLSRNADYNGRELFTDRHQQVGRSIAAVGDYMMVGRTLEVGGGKAGAVVIHPVFVRAGSREVWIEHFVSDDVDRDVGDVGSKFLQAATKLTRQVRARPAEFGANAALACYQRHVAEATYPGLGKNKEYQIQHHIRTMLSVVDSVL